MQMPAHRRLADRYRVDTVLGRGGMGTVWRAQDELLGRAVAVKVIQPLAGFTDGEPAQHDARALREARAAGRLNHPGAVTVHDIVQEGDQFCIVMELIEAPNLAELVKRDGPLPPARVAAIGAQLLDVLDFAHRAGIVHRDIKPANVMVLPGDRVKLTDFGIASLRGDPQLTASGTTIGSPRYMSPEQAAGESAGPPADLWGLGATLYFAVEGRPPFQRPGTTELLAAILTQPPDAMRLAGALRPALTTVLVRAVDERPNAAQLRRLLALAINPDAAAPDAPLQTGQDAEAEAGKGSAAPDGQSSAVVQGRSDATTLAAGPAGVRVGVAGADPTGATDYGRSRLDDRPLAPDAGLGRYGEVHGHPPVPVMPPALPALQRRQPPSRAVVLLSGATAVLTVAVVWLGIDLRHQDQQPAQQRTTISAGTRAGSQLQPTGNADAAKPLANEVLSPSAANAPSTGLAQGSAGRNGLRDLELSKAAPAGQRLPQFMQSATNSVGGYRIGVPPSFDVSATGPTTFAELNDQTFQSTFEVRSYRPADPTARLRQDEALFAGEHAGDSYHLLHLAQPWTYAGNTAVAWDFTWIRNGTLMHGREVAFRHGSRTYTVVYRSTDGFWLGGGSSQYVTDFEQAFTPLP